MKISEITMSPVGSKRKKSRAMEKVEEIQLDEMAIDFKQQDRINKVDRSSFEVAEKLIFQWVKTGKINVKQFSELNDANRNSIN